MKGDERMSEDKDVIKKLDGVQDVKEPGKIFTPPIDISEDDNGINLAVDMPGTDREQVDVTVDNNTLVIEGRPVAVEAPDGYELVSREYEVGRYRREFTLSNDVDSDKIKARSRNGVLYVTIPRKEVQKARKIRIQS
jgi:HSP20 family molecular chaperone IbpA